MIAFLKKMLRDRRGNAIAIAAAALPLVLGSAGLATDTIQWTLWKRQLQRAADSAAIAGAYARITGASPTSAVTTDLTKNNHVWMGWATGYPATTLPADTSTFTNQVSVSLGVQQELPFSSLFYSTTPLITTSATAAAIDDGAFCVVALEDTNTTGITIQGSVSINMGCGMISNSKSASVSVDVIGNGHNVTAEPVAGAGGVEDINGVTNEQSFHLPQTDPYAGKYSTAVPAGVTCTAFNHASKTTAGKKNPGCYTDWPKSGATLNPGVYFLQNASIDMQGNDTLTGTGVTIIFTGTTPGKIDLNGNSKLVLTAPTDATCGNFGGVNSCDYKKMLMIQSTAAALGNDSLINGNNGMVMDGAVYFPRGQLTFSGSSSTATKCAMFVSRRVHFKGNADIQNNTTGCTANTTVPGKKVRLVA